MEKIYAFIGALGAIATIIGLFFTIKHERRSKKSADDASKIKQELINYRRVSELSELTPLLKAARDALNKYCTSNSTSLIGVDKESDARAVQRFLDKIDDLAIHFKDGIAKEFRNDCDSLLQLFLNSANETQAKKHGHKLHREISGFSSVLQQHLKSQQEDTVH